MNVANIKEVRIVCLFSKNVLEWNTLLAVVVASVETDAPKHN